MLVFIDELDPDSGMSWSFHLGKIAGIELRVHVTFFLLLAFIAWGERASNGDWLAVALNVGFVLILFGTVILHELGHALMARKFGIGTRKIMLLPIGGVAELEKMPEKPSEELLVAIAGPAVNVALAAIFLAWFYLSGERLELLTSTTVLERGWVERLFWANLALAIFNLIPAFPMDGGRVLRALLAMQMPRVAATRWAIGVGRVLAIGFAWIGLQSNPVLVLIAIFIWFGGGAELGVDELRHAIQGLRVRDVMMTEYHVLRVNDPLSTAMSYLLDGFQTDFLVIRDSQVVGTLCRDDIVRALAEHGADVLVGKVMRDNYATARPEERLDIVYERLAHEHGKALPVIGDGMLVGMVTTENIGEMLLLARASRQHAEKQAQANR